MAVKSGATCSMMVLMMSSSCLGIDRGRRDLRRRVHAGARSSLTLSRASCRFTRASADDGPACRSLAARPRGLSETPRQPGDPMSHDPLSDVLRSVRLRGAVFYYVSFGGEWAAETPTS